MFEIFERIMPDAEGRAEYHYVLIDYLCRVFSGTLQAASDVSSVAWVARANLTQFRITDGTLAVVLRAFESARQTKNDERLANGTTTNVP